MKCKNIKRLITTYFDEETDQREKEKINTHVKDCECCRRYFNEMEELLKDVREVPGSKAPENFLSRLRAKERTTYRNRVFWLKPALSSAVALAALVLFLFNITRKPDPSILYVSEPQQYNFTGYRQINHIRENSQGYVKINMRSAEALSDVNVRITMPEGLVLSSGEKSAVWSGDLKEGDNMLLLKVRGRSGGHWNINGVLEYKELKKEFSRDVEVL